VGTLWRGGHPAFKLPDAYFVRRLGSLDADGQSRHHPRFHAIGPRMPPEFRDSHRCSFVERFGRDLDRVADTAQISERDDASPGVSHGVHHSEQKANIFLRGLPFRRHYGLVRCKIVITLVLSFLCMILAGAAEARSYRTQAASLRTEISRRSEPPRRRSEVKPNPTRCEFCVRDSRGRIARSRTVRRAFQRANPCPSTGETSGACPGYIADHIIPLGTGGSDAPNNMQWQTREAARAKDRTE
jgi:hypothetical protein